MKILELTNYSSGICGVWQRAKQESELLSRDHEVLIFSSNAIKGEESSDKRAESQEILNKNLKIKRFDFKKLGGESYMSWFNNNAFQKAIEFKPDIIIAHAYRHPHTLQALRLKKYLIKKHNHNCKVFLVTHAPFIEQNNTRSFLSKLSVNLYDFFIGKQKINKFDKVITISHWELPYLQKLGLKKNKITYIPNAIPEEFFKIKQTNLKKSQNKALFLGRVSPIKNLELIIEVAKNFPKTEFNITGPSEEKYKQKLEVLINENKIKNIIFNKPIYSLKSKIKHIDKHNIFILPSKREAMPQSLIEAMARSRLILSSETQGGKEIIKDNYNGFLFKLNSSQDLIKTLKEVASLNPSQKSKIKNQAFFDSQKYKWSVLIKDLEFLF